ncbi:MAG: Rieske (2Fe-2S) protein [Casimicrobiaceae bacterium]
MDDAEQNRPEGLGEPPQPLVGFMTNGEWDELLAHVNGLILDLERIPFPDVKDRTFELLAGIDLIHREALRRLVRLFKEGVLEKVVTDPAIHTLMELYDLLPVAAAAPEDGTPIPIRPHRFPNIPVKVVTEPRVATASRRHYPHWVPALEKSEALAPGSVIEIDLDAHQVLLCRVDDEFFALESHCAQDGASLAGAILKSYTLACPDHPGCFYDVRQGTRIAASGRVDCFPVKLGDDGRVLVGFDMPFTPILPTY